MTHPFTVTQGEAEYAGFRTDMIAKLREIADALEIGSEDYVVVALAHCDYEGVGGPMVMIDGNAASPELVDEICETLKNAMFEGLE